MCSKFFTYKPLFLYAALCYTCNTNMRTTISISLPEQEAKELRARARRRGYPSVSGFVRYLVKESAGDIISDEEILRRSRNADALHKQGKLPVLRSLEDLMEA